MINKFLEDNKVDDLSYMLLEVFEDYHNNNSLSKVNELFGKYFSPINKWYDFMDQIQQNLIKPLNPLDLKIINDAIYNALVLYQPEKHNNETLLSILELAVYAKTSVLSPIREIWRKLEYKGFHDKEQITYALKILKYMAGLTPNKDAYHFFTKIMSMGEYIPYEFMPLTLIVKSHESIDNFSLLINKFSDLGWARQEKEYELKFMIENLLLKLELNQILEQLSLLEPQSYWFVEKLFQSPRVKLSYGEKNTYYGIDTISDQKIKIPLFDTKYYYDFINLLNKLYNFEDDFEEDIIKEVDIDILKQLNYFAESEQIKIGVAA
jgi:hypothetical protein